MGGHLSLQVWKTTLDGRNWYLKKDTSDKCFIFFTRYGSSWQLCRPTGPILYQVDSVKSVPPEKGWHYINGVNPTPTLTHVDKTFPYELALRKILMAKAHGIPPTDMQ